jgi:hypothetical protein
MKVSREPASRQEGVVTSKRQAHEDRKSAQWCTPSEVLNQCRVYDVSPSWCPAKQQVAIETKTVEIFSKLTALCAEKSVCARWIPTHVPIDENYRYKASDTFEEIPAIFWKDGWIKFIWKSSTPDKVNLIIGDNAFPLFVMGPVEVRFRRSDVEHWLCPPTKPKPSRLEPFWDKADAEASAWLQENGCPQRGDGEQARLEKHVADWLAARGHEPAERTVRRHVAHAIENHKKGI